MFQVTKFGSAVLRLVLVSARVITIWIVELIVKWNEFHLLNFFGMLIILFGVLFYNYNYFIKRDSWKGDKFIRKADICLGLKDPDQETSLPTPPDDDRVEGVQ